MLSNKDLKQINNKKISAEEFNAQIEKFKTGSPFLKITAPAVKNHGIFTLTDIKLEKYISLFEKERGQLKIEKFVPSSGAATRMFKDLFQYLETYTGTEEEYLEILTDRSHGSIFYFFEHLNSFAFFPELRTYFFNKNIDLLELLEKNENDVILNGLLSKEGLNYGNLPKGLITFHKYDDFTRKAIEEHMVEGTKYCNAQNNKIPLHFTISEEHKELFVNYLKKVQTIHENKHNVKYSISLSTQEASTDTVAVDMNNKPLRNKDDSLLFRPGGHGALINNLNKTNADIIFIKNIDNVVSDKLRELTIPYKKALGGALIKYQKTIFKYLLLLENPNTIDEDKLNTIIHFIEKDLQIYPPKDFTEYSQSKVIEYLIKKLNRPIRVCGMVANEGEPGGGPFFSENSDGTLSLQIVESHQINHNDEEQEAITLKASYFNPVDIVCSVKNYKGKKFNLSKYIDQNTFFIANKSSNGKELKALELPGLWNGAMSDWNTIFIEVPIETFNPVKVINDLLREEHQNLE